MTEVHRILNKGPHKVRVEEPTSRGNTFVFFLDVGEAANISSNARVDVKNNEVVELTLD